MPPKAAPPKVAPVSPPIKLPVAPPTTAPIAALRCEVVISLLVQAAIDAAIAATTKIFAIVFMILIPFRLVERMGKVWQDFAILPILICVKNGLNVQRFQAAYFDNLLATSRSAVRKPSSITG